MIVHYFPVYGRAEPYRMALAKANAVFENNHVNGEAFTKMKADNPEQLEFQ